LGGGEAYKKKKGRNEGKKNFRNGEKSEKI